MTALTKTPTAALAAAEQADLIVYSLITLAILPSDAREQLFALCRRAGAVSPPSSQDPRFQIGSFRLVPALQELHKGDQLKVHLAEELGIPGVQRAPMPTNLPNRCSNDLVTIDGKTVTEKDAGVSAGVLFSLNRKKRA